MVESDLPRGWSYNPSSWPQRLPLVGLALIGFGIASYLALYQWGVFSTVWEPFFGGGSRAPWALGYGTPLARVNSDLTGALLIVFALVRGRIKQRYGGGWSSLFKPWGLGEE